MSKTVWTFTNQRELDSKEFVDYFQRKVFRTIRKFEMLEGIPPKIVLRKAGDLNTVVLKHVLETKFEVSFGKANLSSENLSQVAEDVFGDVVGGNFKIEERVDAPLVQLSDKEVELYAKLKGLKGTVRKRDENIQKLFGKFLGKNQDLEVNVLKAAGQLCKK